MPQQTPKSSSTPPLAPRLSDTAIEAGCPQRAEGDVPRRSKDDHQPRQGTNVTPPGEPIDRPDPVDKLVVHNRPVRIVHKRYPAEPAKPVGDAGPLDEKPAKQEAHNDSGGREGHRGRRRRGGNRNRQRERLGGHGGRPQSEDEEQKCRRRRAEADAPVQDDRKHRVVEKRPGGLGENFGDVVGGNAVSAGGPFPGNDGALLAEGGQAEGQSDGQEGYMLTKGTGQPEDTASFRGWPKRCGC